MPRHVLYDRILAMGTRQQCYRIHITYFSGPRSAKWVCIIYVHYTMTPACRNSDRVTVAWKVGTFRPLEGHERVPMNIIMALLGGLTGQPSTIKVILARS